MEAAQWNGKGICEPGHTSYKPESAWLDNIFHLTAFSLLTESPLRSRDCRITWPTNEKIEGSFLSGVAGARGQRSQMTNVVTPAKGYLDNFGQVTFSES